ncbi:YheC/YheD family protein [Paenibacillus sp. GD4]|uniref:YheC/YheD family endospore coat-associated protein n=1 Tax=Paenibacillus sp. GD4 TaxID=3068890 RepID=UPI002796BBF6|nr:YheC/YheD family protein [Paenibacillus sp. GD4]MDQ1910040.1 YheC/YheD family protein [Paenibacillus sp. GD4]
MDASTQQKPQRPTLAILTYSDDKRIFRGNQENFIDLIRAGLEHQVKVYVMTVQDFKLTGSSAVGYTYDFAAKRWKKGEQPIPHVIYNRIPFRKFELLPEVQQVIQTCLRHGQIHFFNPSFFNKWNLFEWLSKSGTTKGFIPVTHKLTSSEELDKLLQKHSSLYLKPIRGKAGKGIMKVSLKPGAAGTPLYELSIQEKTKSHISRYTTPTQLWSQVRELVDSKEYIMQQGIDLSSYRQRPFDLRVLVQKNGKGLWSIAGVGARLAGKSSITTHVPRGGSIDDPAKLLASTFGAAGSKRIIVSARRSALLIAKQIEKASGSVLGEMSMDLGVDTDGRLWFFEANSKPMKFDEPHIRKKSLENLILYSAFLSRRKKVRTAAKPGRTRITTKRNASR